MNISQSMAKLGHDFGLDWSKKTDRMLTAMVKRALELPAVQRAIADTFDGSTPMCRVLDKAVEDKVEDVMRNSRHDIDADDIDGLDKSIEAALDHALENFEIETNQIKNLDGAIEDYLDEHSDEIAGNVVDLMAERLRK